MAVEIIHNLKQRIKVLIAIILALSIALVACNVYYVARCQSEIETEDAAPANTYTGRVDMKKRFKNG